MTDPSSVDHDAPAPSRARRMLRAGALGIGQLVAALCGTTIALWLVGCLVSDRYAWSQWVLWLTPTLFAAIAAFIGAVIAWRPTWRRGGSRRLRIGTWTLGALLIVGYGTLVEHRLWRLTPAAPTDAVAVLNWTLSETLATTPDHFSALIDTVRPDVAIVTNAGWHTIKHQRDDLEARGYSLTRRRPFTLVTKWPILVSRPFVAGRDGTVQACVFELDTTPALGRPLRIWAFDLPSDPGIARMDLARDVRQWIDESTETPPDLVVGDLNMTLDSAAVRTMFPAHRHAWFDGGHTARGTFPRAWPMLHIDHLLRSRAWRAARYDIIDPGVGSHRAHVAWLVAAPDDD